MTTPHHTEVFHIDRATGWAFAVYDAERNQIGEAAYEFRQRDAIAGARRWHPELPTHVFKRDGALGRIVHTVLLFGSQELTDEEVRVRAELIAFVREKFREGVRPVPMSVALEIVKDSVDHASTDPNFADLFGRRDDVNEEVQA